MVFCGLECVFLGDEEIFEVDTGELAGGKVFAF